ncbi:Cell wall-associated NlpC family hydrolase [Citricoccus sp. K5]|nr:Cell wall-associated NlpC family hydrolase [Citricoccus sp. K5]
MLVIRTLKGTTVSSSARPTVPLPPTQRPFRHRIAAFIGATALMVTAATAGVAADVMTASPATAAQCSSSNFSDVKKTNKAYYSAVTWAYCNGITMGYSDGTYGVHQNITRAEVATLLFRQVTPKYVQNGQRYFIDVPATGQYYSGPITWMAQAALSTGYADRSFGVGRDITRGEMAAFIYRLAGATKKGPNYSPFTDMGWSTSFYHDASWLQANGIARGYADGTFRPQQNITRGETAIMLQNAHRFIAHRGDVSTPAISPLPNQADKPSTTAPSWTSKVVSWATAKAKDPRAQYQWGGNGPWEYDCSGFTVDAFKAAGRSLPRTARAQHGAATSYVPVSQAKPGDLVYWSNNGSGSGVYHIAVVIGGGKIAHARNEKEGLSITSINYSPYNMLGQAGRYY